MIPKNATPFAIMVALFFATCGHVLAQDSTAPKPPAIRVALDGDCCVSLFEMNAYVKGEEAFSSQWRGLRYLFLSEEEKVVFDSNPEKYAVAFGGLDIVATYGLEGTVEDAKRVLTVLGETLIASKTEPTILRVKRTFVASQRTPKSTYLELNWRLTSRQR